MKFVRKAIVVVLVAMMLAAAAVGQTLRPGNDPRNQAPTVGTGGTPGGPTGLFTIYDGDTIRKGEFTFSVAYSNYDRDPGDVDITVVPLSFNIGINDHLELFYSTEGYRGVKVNNPRNLSGFYLPNSQLFFSATTLGSGPAIILPPERVSGSTALTGLSDTFFRPAFNQPFVQFPFVGGPGPNFGLTGNRIAPPFTSRLGTPSAVQSNFGAASNFPGVGSPCGSILPGVVLTTRTIPANLTFNTLTVPDLFTICPTYIADAPFINRLYGESSFGTHHIGAKYRFTGPNNPLGVGVIAFWRFYLDHAKDFKGFNQLQRGASPGGNIGDFGIGAFISGRLSRSVNISANATYILNSNPKSDAFGTGGDVVLLDRPNELITGVGFDFPINRHFQPIAELKSDMYVGSHTPNAFPNNPLDFLGGIRIFPKRWFGFSAWYRAHLNQQGDRLFHSQDFPAGFEESTDPHGFGFQVFAGHRNERLPTIFPNHEPKGALSVSTTEVTLPATCTPPAVPDPSCAPTAATVNLSAKYTDEDGDTLYYTWSTTVPDRKVSGDGPNATLDLTGVAPGTYTVTVEVDDGCGCVAFDSKTVTVKACDCYTPPQPKCPDVRVTCPDTAKPGDTITFTASVSGGDTSVTPTYNWAVSAGTISSGQGTKEITVDTTGLAGGTTVTATVEVGGYGMSCPPVSCTTSLLTQPPRARKIDEYDKLRFNDEKARLDHLAIELQNDPTAKAAIITYGGRDSRPGEAERRYRRAHDYLVNERKISEDRILPFADPGGLREEPWTELWIVPAGAPLPQATPTVQPSEVRKRPAHRRRGRRRGHDDDE